MSDDWRPYGYEILKLNLGCGYDYREGWVNIDIDWQRQTDMCCDITMLPYDNNTVDEIYAAHVLEHLPLDEDDPIEEWHRVLKPGGVITIIIPDFMKAYALFMDEEWTARQFNDSIFGLQKLGEAMKHRQVLSHNILLSRMRPFFPDAAETTRGAGTHVEHGDGQTMVQGHKEK